MIEENLTISRRIYLKNLLLGGFISKHRIREKLSKKLDFHPGLRTIERDISYLQSLGYEIETKIDARPGEEERNKKYVKLYRIQPEDYEEILFERLSNELLLSKSSKAFNQNNIIRSPGVRGLHFVFKLLELVNRSLMIELEYEPFKQPKRSIIVAPLKLKEYLNEWHLIAYDFENREFKTFGANRIISVKSLEQYKVDEIEGYNKAIESFEMRLGVTRSLDGYFQGGDVHPQTIKIWVSSFYLDYLDSKPLHHSHKMTNEKMNHRDFVTGKITEYTLVTYDLIPNYDLIKAIVSQLGDFILAEPIALKEYIREKFQGLISEVTMDKNFRK